MKGINKVIILGQLGKDPDVRFLPNGGAVANISVATSDSWKDKSTGEKKEKTEWHKVVIFGKLAEIAGEYLKKGSKVYLEGQSQTRKWTNQQGQDQYTTEVVLQGYGGVMQMLDSKQQQQPQNGYQQTNQQNQQNLYSQPNNPNPNQQFASQQQQPSQQLAQKRQDAQQQRQPQPVDFDDDIPF